MHRPDLPLVFQSQRASCETHAGSARRPEHILFATALSGLLLSACSSSPPTVGEKLIARGDNLAQIGESWEEGQELLRDGRELVADGREQIEDGNEDVADGERMIRKGQRMIKDAERQYREATGKELPVD